MNGNELLTVITISEQGSIKKAAQVLLKDMSSLSRCVKRVEKELDITLFRRTPLGLVLTPEGELYVEAARKMLELYEGLKTEK